jgi:hypothetical protein
VNLADIDVDAQEHILNKIKACFYAKRGAKIVDDSTVSLKKYFELAFVLRPSEHSMSTDCTKAWLTSFTKVGIESVADLLRQRGQLDGDLGVRLLGVSPDGVSVPAWFLCMLFSPRAEHAYKNKLAGLGEPVIEAIGGRDSNGAGQVAQDLPALPADDDLPLAPILPPSSYLDPPPTTPPLVAPMTPALGGLCGLKNTGVKCFGISSIQALSAVPSMNAVLMGRHLCSLQGNCMFHQAGQVLREVTKSVPNPLEPRTTTFAPVERLLVHYGLHQFQEDAHDFLSWLLQAGVECELQYFGHAGSTLYRYDASMRHHDEFRREETSRLAQLVNVHTRCVFVDVAGHTSSSVQASHGVSLELKWDGGQAGSVQDALNHFVAPEAGGIMKRCSECDVSRKSMTV